MEYRKFGRFSERTILAAIKNDRDAAAAATDGWHHSHGCVIDRDGTILSWVGGQKNLYHDKAERDPIKEIANARFIVGARSSVERRCDMIEALLAHIVELENRK